MQRDLFGRTLGIALNQQIDLSKIVEYLLTVVPLSLCHGNSTISKTDESALMKLLEPKINPSTTIPSRH